jgi:putative endonuclease
MGTTCQVYVLQNRVGKFYIGVSADSANRLVQHNAGVSKWTAKFRPWKLVWTSDPMTLSAARKLENLLKRQKGGRGFYQITGLARPGSGS